jgi:hypothetical protein
MLKSFIQSSASDVRPRLGDRECGTNRLTRLNLRARGDGLRLE